jgi:hypothetical protein
MQSDSRFHPPLKHKVDGRTRQGDSCTINHTLQRSDVRNPQRLLVAQGQNGQILDDKNHFLGSK